MVEVTAKLVPCVEQIDLLLSCTSGRANTVTVFGVADTAEHPGLEALALNVTDPFCEEDITLSTSLMDVVVPDVVGMLVLVPLADHEMAVKLLAFNVRLRLSPLHMVETPEM